MNFQWISGLKMLNNFDKFAVGLVLALVAEVLILVRVGFYMRRSESPVTKVEGKTLQQIAVTPEHCKVYSVEDRGNRIYVLGGSNCRAITVVR